MSNVKAWDKVGNLLNFVLYHRCYEEAYQTVEDALLFRKQTGKPRCVMLLGASGSGKSTLKNDVARKYPALEMEDRQCQPVLCVNVAVNPTMKSMAEAILAGLSDPNGHRGTEKQVTERIVHLAKKKSVQLILFDEAQHFVDHGTKEAQKRMSDWLKQLINRMNVSVALVGLPRARILLMINEQLRRRFSQCMELETFGIDTKEQRNLFSSVIKALSVRLIDQEEFQKQFNGELMTRLYYASNGIMDYLVKLLSGAYEMSVQRDGEMLSMGTLEAAFTRYIWCDGKGSKNPFNHSFEWDHLDLRKY